MDRRDECLKIGGRYDNGKCFSKKEVSDSDVDDWSDKHSSGEYDRIGPAKHMECKRDGGQYICEADTDIYPFDDGGYTIDEIDLQELLDNGCDLLFRPGVPHSLEITAGDEWMLCDRTHDNFSCIKVVTSPYDYGYFEEIMREKRRKGREAERGMDPTIEEIED